MIENWSAFFDLKFFYYFVVLSLVKYFMKLFRVLCKLKWHIYCFSFLEVDPLDSVVDCIEDFVRSLVFKEWKDFSFCELLWLNLGDIVVIWAEEQKGTWGDVESLSVLVLL